MKKLISHNEKARRDIARGIDGIFDRAKKYGVGPDQCHDALVRQNGLCPGCHRVDRRLIIDHDHGTGKFRGLLCQKCNTAIGMAQDSPKTLANLRKYLIESGKGDDE